jgi:cobalt-zinc-cadmium efflux system protein
MPTAGTAEHSAHEARAPHAHSHRHDHGRRHDHGAGRRRFALAFWLISGFMVVEAVGGLLSGSLALTADAGHMLVDALALGLAWFAAHLTTRPASRRRSFGYARTQVLVAFVNSLLLLGIVAVVVIEAVHRLLGPTPINARLALLIGAAGVGVNLLAAYILHGGHALDLNRRAAYLHVLSDLAGSLAVVLAATIVLFTGWLQADSWLSLVVAALIARGAWRLLVDSAHVLQEGVPQGLDVPALQARLVASVPAVVDVHHVHAWSLTARDVLLTLHVRLAAGADPGQTLQAVKHVLLSEYGIDHSTVQVEPADCVDPEQHCDGEPVVAERFNL